LRKRKGSSRACFLVLSSVRMSSCAFFLWNCSAEIAERSAIASVESWLEKGCGGGGDMYCVGGMAAVAGAGALDAIVPVGAAGGAVGCAAVAGVSVCDSACCAGRVAGSAGCTFGVMGL